jgi:hypothetical protein
MIGLHGKNSQFLPRGGAGTNLGPELILRHAIDYGSLD